MLDALKQLFENNVISEDVKVSIEKAWESRVNENRNVVSQQLREEYAQKYEHDKSTMVTAVDRMITEQLASEITEFAEDRKNLAEMRIKYAKKMQSDGKVLKEFITRQLTSEVKELHEDQVLMANKFGKLETFVIEALAQEITEFYNDKQDLSETKVRLIREGREQLKKIKEQFIKRAATLVERTINESLSSEIVSLKEDIEAARRADFGRKLFEAFASEYQTSYLNEKSETAKLLKVIDTKDLAIKEAAKAVVSAESLLESKQAEIRALKEAQNRSKIMNELLSPLNGEQRVIMSELMETVKTSKLNESFEKYLPAVINGKSQPKRRPLVEAKEFTGNKVSDSNQRTNSEVDVNIIDIRKLAGLKI